MKSDTAVRSFKDLKAWQEGHHLLRMVYKVTKTLPREETKITAVIIHKGILV